MRKILNQAKKWILKPWEWFKKLSLKKKIIAITAGLIALIVIFQVVANITKPSPFSIQKASLGDITEVVTETGNIVSSGKTDVYSPTNGVVIESYVKNGDLVNAGDILFKVKSSATDQEAHAANANYLTAVATLNAAEANSNTLRADMYTKWKSFTDLATNTTYEKADDVPDLDNRKAAEFQSSQDTWLAAEKRYKDQQTVVSQAKALVSSSLRLYRATQDATVTAPVSGTIENLSVSDNSTVAIKSVAITGSPSTPALVISTESANEILIEVPETDIIKIKSGQEVEITVSAVPNKIYKGIVDRADSIGSNNDGVITFNAYIKLTNPDSDIRQGMTADVEIVTSKLVDVLSVPNSAVKPYQGGRAVRIPDNTAKEKFKYVPVIIGIRGDARTQILKGISEGQEVITTISNENIKRPGLFGS